jgi:outer membrane cobalamin receptor
VCAVAVVLCAFGRAGADVPPARGASTGRVYEQDTVVVDASRVGLRLSEFATAGTILSRAQIRAAHPPSVPAGLTGVPGLSLFDLSGSGSQEQVESRGYSSLGRTSHVLAMLDGIPLNDLSGSRVDWGLIAPGQLQRVEVLRGPASFLWGDAAMAGVIDLVGDDENGIAEFSAGGNGALAVTSGASWGGTRRVAASGSFRRSDGWRAHSRWSVGEGYATARSPLFTRWRWGVSFLACRAKQDVPGALPDPLWRSSPALASNPALPDPQAGDDRDVGRLLAGVRLSGPLRRGLNGAFTLSGDLERERSRETVIPVGTLDRGADGRVTHGSIILDWALRPGGLDLLMGTDVAAGWLESTYHEPGSISPAVGEARNSRTSVGTSLLVRYRSGLAWTVLSGGRFDWTRNSVRSTAPAPGRTRDGCNAFSPSLGITHHSGLGDVRLTASGAFKAPTLEQLYDPRPFPMDPDGPGPVPGMILQVSNHALRPQRGFQCEAGLARSIQPGLRLDVAGYYGRSRDEIGFDLARFRYDNIIRTVHAGVESRAEWAVGSLAHLRLTYSWTHAVFDGGANEGRQINGVPRHLLDAGMDIGPLRGGRLTAALHHVGDEWLDEANTRELPSHVVEDVGWTQEFGRRQLFAQCRNVFDRRYASTGYLTVDARGEPLPLYYPGQGRSLYAGMRWGN